MSDTPIKAVNLAASLASFSEQWSPRIVGQVNQMHVKVVKVQGEFTWHHHDVEDELFLVIKGELVIQLKDQADVRVREGEFVIIPHGVEHCPLAEEECHIMLFEPAGTLNTGNVHDDKTFEAQWLE
jgi:mannose-6-phosphate isomerase-like protein (cupin superfamily)